MRFAQHSLIGVACVAALLACNRDRDRTNMTADDEPSLGDRSGAPRPGERVGTTTVTRAEMRSLANSAVIQQLVAARCAREMACNNVGADKRFSDHDLCTRELSTSIGSDLDVGECPRGIDPKPLEECVESIRAESCTNPVDTLSRLAKCRSSALCVDAADSKNSKN